MIITYKNSYLHWTNEQIRYIPIIDRPEPNIQGEILKDIKNPTDILYVSWIFYSIT